MPFYINKFLILTVFTFDTFFFYSLVAFNIFSFIFVTLFYTITPFVLYMYFTFDTLLVVFETLILHLMPCPSHMTPCVSPQICQTSAENLERKVSSYWAC